MKTLLEIIRDAMLLLDEGRESVVIARGQQHEPLDGRSEAFQIRLRCSEVDTRLSKVSIVRQGQLTGLAGGFPGREITFIGNDDITLSPEDAASVAANRFAMPTNYSCEARSWLGGQWSSWSVHHGWLGGAGFDIRDVLATDWRISS